MANKLMGALLVLLALLPAGWCQGEGTNRTVITSDRLTFDYKRYTAVFEGHVVVVDPQVRIESDELRVMFNKTNEVKSVTAIGNVKMSSEDKVATCSKAVYISETGEILMTGNARLIRGKDTITGERVTFYLNENRVNVEGGTRLIFSPEGDTWKMPKR